MHSGPARSCAVPLPVTDEAGTFIGAIGVGGGMPADDDQVAEAAGTVFAAGH
jgi:uncharacterized protein GlcG (DUF336 family)